MSDVPALPVPRLVLWRHGRTEWNAAGRFQGQLDPPLDDVGRRQARRAAPHLAAPLPEGTLVVSSDLGRAAETAVALTDVLGVPLRLDARLREVGMGSWEGLTRQEVAERHPGQYADWLAGRPIPGRGGEDAADVPARALAALCDLPEAPAAIVVSEPTQPTPATYCANCVWLFTRSSVAGVSEASAAVTESGAGGRKPIQFQPARTPIGVDAFTGAPGCVIVAGTARRMW